MTKTIIQQFQRCAIEIQWRESVTAKTVDFGNFIGAAFSRNPHFVRLSVCSIENFQWRTNGAKSLLHQCQLPRNNQWRKWRAIDYFQWSKHGASRKTAAEWVATTNA